MLKFMVTLVTVVTVQAVITIRNKIFVSRLSQRMWKAQSKLVIIFAHVVIRPTAHILGTHSEINSFTK